MKYTNNILRLDNSFFVNMCKTSDNMKNIASEKICVVTDAEPFYSYLGDRCYKTIHPQIELITKGSICVSIDDKIYNLKKGCLITYPQYAFVSIQNISEDYDSVGFDFDIEECYNYDVMTIPHTINTSHEVYELAKQYINLIYQTIKYDTNDFIALKCLVFALLLLIKKNTPDCQSLRERCINARSKEIFNKFICLVRDENNDLSLSIEDYAQQLNISKSHLQNTVKRISELNVTNIIKYERLRRAKMMLSGDVDVKIVYEKLKFRNCYEFSRFFKQEVGLTPTEYKSLKIYRYR